MIATIKELLKDDSSSAVRNESLEKDPVLVFDELESERGIEILEVLNGVFDSLEESSQRASSTLAR